MLYENEIVIAQRVVDGIFNVNAKDTPFLSQLATAPKAKNILINWAVDEYMDSAFGGVMEGADVTTFDKESRQQLQAYLQIFRESWMISDLADVTGVEHLKSEKGEQRMKAFIRLKRAIARAALSANDTQAQAGAATPYRTRGAFSWLQTSAQTTLPVPEAYRPDAEYTGTLANFKPSSLQTLLKAASNQVDQAVTLQAHTGLSLKSRMSEWGQRDEDASATEFARIQYGLDGSKKELLQVVDRFVFDEGTVYSMPNFNIARNVASGAATDYSTRSGVFINPKLWKKRFMQDLSKADLENRGGGPRGYCKAIGGVLCMNPRGQFRVYISSDS